MYAYKDSNGDVVALSKKARTVVEAQAKDPTILAVIPNAPSDLVPKNLSRRRHSAPAWFHRHMRGDGSDLAHYDVVERIRDHKTLRNSDVDDRTKELLAEGFRFDGHTFSMSLEAQTNWQWIAIYRPSLTFPLEISAADGTVYPLTGPNVAGFLAAYSTHLLGTLAAGHALRKQVNQAKTKVDLDKVRDSR